MDNLQDQLAVYEDVYDALRAAIQILGGTKKVAARLWSTKPIGAAQIELSDALNRERPRKLTPEEFITIVGWAREAEFHALMNFVGDQTGYSAKPVSKSEEIGRLTFVVEQSSKTLSAAIAALERIQHGQPLRVAK